MKKPLFDKVTIVGVGLIGGSLGLAIKKHRLAKLVVGVVRPETNARKIRKILKRKIVDVVVRDLQMGVAGSDLVILATPIETITEHLKVVGKYTDPKSIIIDVGSTKEKIHKTADLYFSKLGKRAPQFVGCHPMAGSEKVGFESSRENLFEGASCYITSKRTKASNKISYFWHELGAHTPFISPETHDVWVCHVSHIPHIFAFALFQNLPITKHLAVTNPSIKEFLRLAQSDSELWAQILLSNRDTIPTGLKILQKNLTEWNKALIRNDKTKIKRFIKRANKPRFHIVWGNIAWKKVKDGVVIAKQNEG